MTREVLTCSPDSTLDAVVDTMIHRHVKRLPVVENNVVVGVVARSDVVRALAGQLAAPGAVPLGDAQIRAAINASLAGQTWAGKDSVWVTVRDGVVELEGTIFDVRQRDAARVLAENTPGVKQVVDRLAWIEPMSGILLDQDGDDKSAPET